MLEKSIEAYLVKQVKLKNGLALKLNSSSMIGLPDRMVLLPKGKIFFAELKRPKGGARTLQISVHDRLRKLGFNVYVIDSKEQVKEVIKYYDSI